MFTIQNKSFSYKSLIFSTKNSYLFLISIIILINIDNPDRTTYEYIFYSNDASGLVEIGFKKFILILKFLGINNFQFVNLILSLLTFITFNRFKKYIKNLNFMMILYFIFPFFMDIIQIRNTIMVMIMLNGFLNIIEHKYLSGIILTLISCTFHSFGIVILLIFIISKVFFKKVELKRFIFISCFLNLINILIGKFILLKYIKYVPINIIKNKIPIYLSEKPNWDTFIIWGSILVLDIILINFMIKKIKDDKTYMYIINNNFFKTLYLFLLSSTIFIGFSHYIYEYNRIFRFMFIIKYIIFSYLIPYLNQKEQRIVTLYLIFSTLFFGFIYYIRGINYDSILLSNLINKYALNNFK